MPQELKVISQPRGQNWSVVWDGTRFYVARPVSLEPMSKKYRFMDAHAQSGYLRVKDENDLWGMIKVPSCEEVIPCEKELVSVPYSDGRVFFRNPGDDAIYGGSYKILPQVE